MKTTLLKIFTLGMFYTLVGQVNAQRKVVIDENFDNNQNEWYVDFKEDYGAEIRNGKYVLSNIDTTGGAWFFNPLDIDPDNENFELEVKMRQISGVDNYGYGLLWSMYKDKSSFKVFYLSSNGMAKLTEYYNKEYHIMMPWESFDFVNPMGQYNTLKIVKVANVVTFYINGHEIKKSGAFSYFGHRFGFYINDLMTIEVDYFKLTKWPITEINYVKNYNQKHEKVSLGDAVNQTYRQQKPVISTDEKTLYYTVKDEKKDTDGAYHDEIWVSTQDANGNWRPGKNIGKPLNNDGHNFVISVAPDNNTLFLANSYNTDGSSGGSGLSVSYLTPSGWGIPHNIEIEDFENVNDYVGYFISASTKVLILASERTDEGFGYNDLYVSFMKDDGTFTKPLNLGSTVNSFGQEATPYLAPDGKTLFFSSNGHYGLGDFDIFVTKRLDDTWTNWTKPANLGPSINTKPADLGYYLNTKGNYAYVSSNSDLHRVHNPVPPEPVVVISGHTYNKKTNKPIWTDIRYYNLKTRVEVGRAISNPITGAYTIVLPYGEHYGFRAEKKGFFPIGENLKITKPGSYTELKKDLYLIPFEENEEIELTNLFFESDQKTIKEESYVALNHLITRLNESPNLTIKLVGEKEHKLDDEHTKLLTGPQLKSIQTYLTSHGVSRDRIVSNGQSDLMVIPVVEFDPKQTKIEEPVKPIEDITKKPNKTMAILLGNVTDAATGKPVEARIRVTRNPDMSYDLFNKSQYAFELPPANNYTVQIDAKGYVSTSFTIDLSGKAGKKTTKNVLLEPIKVGTTVKLKNVLFERGKAIFLPSSYAELDLIAEMMRNNPDMKIFLSGHTDNTGRADLNQKLSQERVNTVIEYLVQQGVNRNRLTGKGFGGSKPIASNTNETSRQLNRRVEFTIVE